MKNRLIITLCCLSAYAGAQQLPDMGIYKVRVNEPDRNVQAEIKPVGSGPELETDRSYYWYSAGKIKITQGGFSGKLLNGQYSSFYLNQNLREQGLFKKGLKDAVWKSWSENGTLLQTVTWKNGSKEGEFELFDEKGKLKQKATYHHNQLDGKQFNYDGPDSVRVVNYRDGKLVSTKTSFFRKINIFKKK
ncbi:toxin-antitoxin system YwqK family antitoxin [Mucilaginibacter sp. AW1-3]